MNSEQVDSEVEVNAELMLKSTFKLGDHDPVDVEFVSAWRAQLFRAVGCVDAVQPHVPSDAHASLASKLNWATLDVDPLTPKRCTVTSI